MGGGGGGGPQIIPFNMSELAPLMPSVFNGPYNAEGAYQNEQNIAGKYSWITPPAGQFEGAQPGQFAGANNGPQFGFFGSGVPAAPNPNPPIPPTLQGPQTPMPSNNSGQYNQMAMAGNQVNAMQPSSLQQILAVLGAQAPAAAPGGSG